MGIPRIGGPAAIAALLSFNGGFVDTVGFLGLQGLFVAHVTGNFVTLGAALVQGSHGIVGKILALPEFIVVIALARLAGTGCVRASFRCCEPCSWPRSFCWPAFSRSRPAADRFRMPIRRRRC
jgi:uncharacterized membrane protein YoaK (UPF0700 family)